MGDSYFIDIDMFGDELIYILEDSERWHLLAYDSYSQIILYDACSLAVF